jgi:hypothetical protein
LMGTQLSRSVSLTPSHWMCRCDDRVMTV